MVCVPVFSVAYALIKEWVADREKGLQEKCNEYNNRRR